MGRPRTLEGVTADPGTPLYFRQRYAANRERYSTLSNDRQRRKKLADLGVSEEQYDHLIALGCAICGALEPGERRLSIDHDHETGEFRGVLCSSCNGALGLMGDDIARLAKAIEYLDQANFARNAAKWKK